VYGLCIVTVGDDGTVRGLGTASDAVVGKAATRARRLGRVVGGEHEWDVHCVGWQRWYNA
jgi:hypothetical protein